MEKKEFKQLTTKIYEEYGFVKKGKYYYLDLDDVLICSGFASVYGITYLAYNFSVKAVNPEETRELNNMFDGYDSCEQLIYFDKNAEAIQKREICYKTWDQEYYAKKLRELLHYYFDPYKKDALDHIRKCYQIIGYVHEGEIIMLKKNTRNYLGI
jgi:hypothetical protein